MTPSAVEGTGSDELFEPMPIPNDKMKCGSLSIDSFLQFETSEISRRTVFRVSKVSTFRERARAIAPTRYELMRAPSSRGLVVGRRTCTRRT